MRRLATVFLLVLVSGMALAQSTAQSSGAPNTNVSADDLKALRQAIADQQQQIAQQQQQIEAMKKALEKKTAAETPHVEDAALHTDATPNANVMQGDEKPKESPLSFRIGGAEFTPGGFVDFENVFRSTNTGNSTATSFGAIPFSNTIQGHLTEYRATGQYSRFNLKTHAKFGENDVTGYIEADFNGNDAANVFVTSNPHTSRVRLYWLDLKRGRWEFLGGQSWGLLTPNRVGLSPNPADLLLTYNEDANVQVGIQYTRAGTFRATWHPTDKFQWAWAIENPDQYVGAGEVIYPFGFNAQLGPQFDAANQTTVPNVAPDFMTKMAYDTDPDGRHMHFEVGGIITSAKITVLPTGGTTFVHNTKVGGGINGAMVLSLTKNLRFVANGLYGNGVGRYIIGLGPNAVVVPTTFGAGCPPNCSAQISMVHSGDGLAGMEWQATPKTLLAGYYGGAYFARNAFPDPTSPLVIKPIIGFGGINSPNSANRAIQEATLNWTQTFWKNPQYGAVLLVTQASYLTRAPWFVAAGAPKNAHLTMGYLSLRYVLP